MFNVNNKKLVNFKIFKTLTCGIRLRGSDVSLIKSGGVGLDKSYISLKGNCVYISGYAKPHESKCLRSALLLNKDELFFIKNLLKDTSFVLIPNSLIKESNLFKLKISVCKKLVCKRRYAKLGGSSLDLNKSFSYA